MSTHPLEVADIFRARGSAWRERHHGHVSLGQLKVMSAIEHCRQAELGGHVLRCQSCEDIQIAYNSCRNRHCPKCQATAALRWLEDREDELLPVEYYHVVFTLPAQISDIAYQNKSVIYTCLFKAAAETLEDHCCRSPAFRCADWRDHGLAYLGVGSNPSSPYTLHCPRGWLLI